MKRLKWPVIALAVVVVLGTGGYAVAQTRDSGTSYSTAKATRADVERTLDLSGTVTATGRRDLTFGTSGEVSSVAVKAGRRVRAGQVLARLDRTALEAGVTSAVATLAKAQAQLASDKDAQATTVSTAATTSGSSAQAGSSSPSTSTSTSTAKSTSKKSGSGSSGATGTLATKSDPAVQQALAALADQQRAVTAAQTAAGTAITAAKAALAAQTEACQAATNAGGAADAGDADDDGSSAAGATGSTASDECTQALAAVQDAQDSVAAKQDQLQAVLETLAGTLGKAVTAVQKSAHATTQSAAPSSGQASGHAGSSSQDTSGSGSAPVASGSGSTGSAGAAGSAGASGTAGRTVTAATLAKDQADIDTARAQLTEARAERRLAVLRAPYAGRVLQVDVAKGDQVADSDNAVVLVGAGVTTVTATVTTAQVPSVRRGQDVTVIPSGWTTALRGTVTEIGLLPDDSSSYPVTITVPAGRAVAEGSTASVSIVTGAAHDAVTVPTSAVVRTGNRAVVRVLSRQTVTRTVVTLGVVGTRRVAVTRGLEAGDTVVLADLDAALPSTDSTQGNRQRFAGSGFGPGAGGAPTTRVGGR